MPPLTPWKPEGRVLGSRCSNPLQFGHGSDAVETARFLNTDSIGNYNASFERVNFRLAQRPCSPYRVL